MKPYQTLLYYHYTFINDPERFASDHLQFCKKLCLTGRIIVASEGLNGSVSGTVAACSAYRSALISDDRFSDMDFKVDEEDVPSFSRLHCRHKREIVHSGIGVSFNSFLTRKGMHLEPDEFAKIKDRENVVLLDVRSNYEHQLGKFRNARTLDIAHFRDFASKVDDLKDLKSKTVITYCTGGIKCEKASAFLVANGFQEVYQLKGGIINYAKKTGGADFDGRCYVFDKRLSVKINRINPQVIARCKTCGEACERMINCANASCNEHFVQCESCSGSLKGCCSHACTESATLRLYDGSGYYLKSLNFI